MRLTRADKSVLSDWWFTVDRLMFFGLLLLMGAGLVLSLAAIGIAGQISPAEVRLGAGMVPFTFLGLWAGLRLSGALDRGPLRPAVLAFAGAAGAFALLRAVL